MAVKRGGLGKGLDSLIPDTGKTAEKEKKVKVMLHTQVQSLLMESSVW